MPVLVLPLLLAEVSKGPLWVCRLLPQPLRVPVALSLLHRGFEILQGVSTDIAVQDGQRDKSVVGVNTSFTYLVLGSNNRVYK